MYKVHCTQLCPSDEFAVFCTSQNVKGIGKPKVKETLISIEQTTEDAFSVNFMHTQSALPMTLILFQQDLSLGAKICNAVNVSFSLILF